MRFLNILLKIDSLIPTAFKSECDSKIKGIVNDQTKLPQNCRLAKYPMSQNGCEIVAVHNVNVLLGRDKSLGQTAKLAVDSKALILGAFSKGYFGTNPYSVAKILKAENIKFKKVEYSESYDDGLYIFSFWNSRRIFSSLHTVAVLVKGETVVFNGDKRLLSDKRRFITGYKIESI